VLSLSKKGKAMNHRLRKYRMLARRKTRRLDKYFHKHPLRMFASVIFAVFALSGILFLTLSGQTVGAPDSHIVILYADRKTKTLPTREETVGEFLGKAEVTLHEGDVVEPALDSKIEEDNFHINVYRASPVVVYDGDKVMHGLSAALTPRSIAEQAGAQLYPEDGVLAEPSDDFLKDGSIGTRVTITRAVPATLNLYGSQLNVRTHAKTVGDLLKEKKVKLASNDTVTPAVTTILSSDTQVFVTRFGTQVVTTQEEIPAPTETVQDNTLSFGTTVIRQVGAAGKKSVTYQIELKNGIEVSRQLIQEVIVQAPVKQIVARGQAVQIPSDKESIMRAAGIADSDFPYVYFIINHENGLWCPTRYQGTSGCPAYYVEKYPGAETNTSTGYGLCQATPGAKMASAGDDWRTNAVTQLRWCSGYANARYGSWGAAYEHWLSHNNW
jgi:uncharacterized protein YabE (DUF348 family)